MVEALQMFLFLFKSKYRRKPSWFSPFLCSVIIVLLFCYVVASKCNNQNCVNGVCKNETCVCFEGWQGSECQYCGGKIKLTSLSGTISDGPGNYSVSVQCSWVIAPEHEGSDPPPIRVRLENFATECGWDHLYVYDGDSVRAEKLLAVYSGVFQNVESSWTRQVIARSGKAMLHFFSDDAYAMEGFNVTYSVYACPSDNLYTNCSDHGVCENGTCACYGGWSGVACDEQLCPDDCHASAQGGSCTPSGCECTEAFAGVDCARPSSEAGWARGWEHVAEDSVPPVAGHKLLVHGDGLVMVGGEMFQDGEFLYRYSIPNRQWSVLPRRGAGPAPRFLHSAAIDGGELVVYGGVVAQDDPERGGGLAGLEGRGGWVSNEVWRLQLDAPRPHWRNATPTACGLRPPPLGHCGGLHVSGHSAVIVHTGPSHKPVMLVFFGHSPHYGYLHIIQEYHLEDGVWSWRGAGGWSTRAGFGHSLAHDPLGPLLLHGGLLSESEAAQAPSAALHEYDIENKIWRPLPPAPTPRYLHTATFISPGIMLVFGGNAHNDSAAAAGGAGARCYSAHALIYHTRCLSWWPVPTPEWMSRAAHAAVVMPDSSRPTVVIHGGFDGRLRSDALIYEAGATTCSQRVTEYDCLSSAKQSAIACVWKTMDKICVPIEEVGWKRSFDPTIKACLVEPVLDEQRCGLAASCGACTAAGCAWCGGCVSSPAYCQRHRHQMALSPEECAESGPPPRESCAALHSCAACHAHRAVGAEHLGHRLCYWDYDTIKCRPANTTDGRMLSPNSGCSSPCASFESCANCTAEECIWCASAARCVDKNAYGASFPLGGCRAWSTTGTGASCSGASNSTAASGCASLPSCSACRAEPACGWCDDGAGSGTGVCMPGGDNRPHAPYTCPNHRWHFTACPACQCNGHAVCEGVEGGEGRLCLQPCSGRAIGEHCQFCAPGHWGSALNGQTCKACECNGHASSCAPDTGRCYCNTKGLAGERCEKCDVTNHYHADLYNKGFCYYDLAVDYQFTFNLSKKEDRHLSAIFFRNSPVKSDVDADFSITCSSHARMNLTVRTRAQVAERTLFAHVNCTNFRYKFAKSEHSFGIEDNMTLTTFFVYVYDFKPPLWIQISFSQYPKLNLQQFFITFSSCFLLLLMVAAALWKIKQKYDLYRRRQRLFVEMEQMASRPFSQVCVELERGSAGGGPPAPVALEPCRGSRAAVLSLLVRLPTGGTGRAPPLGGLAVASALVTLGQHHATAEKRLRHH